MALTTQGHFMINDDIQEYVAKSLKVNNKSVSVNALIKYFNDIFEEGNHE